MAYIETTLGDMLRERAKNQPDHDFLVYSDRNLRFTYSEFDRRVDQLSSTRWGTIES